MSNRPYSYEIPVGSRCRPGTRFFVHLSESRISGMRRKTKVSLATSIMHFMKNHLYSLAFLLSIIIWCTSVYLLLAKAPNVGVRVPPYGAHTVMFFGLAFMTTCSQRRPKILLTLTALFLFGAVTEVAQHFNPPRTCDPIDFMEDVIGATLGLVAAIVWIDLLRRFLRSNFWHRMTKKDVVAQIP